MVSLSDVATEIEYACEMFFPEAVLKSITREGQLRFAFILEVNGIDNKAGILLDEKTDIYTLPEGIHEGIKGLKSSYMEMKNNLN